MLAMDERMVGRGGSVRLLLAALVIFTAACFHADHTSTADAGGRTPDAGITDSGTEAGSDGGSPGLCTGTGPLYELCNNVARRCLVLMTNTTRITADAALTLPRFEFIALYLVVSTRRAEYRGPLGYRVHHADGEYRVVSLIAGGTVVYRTHDAGKRFDHVREAWPEHEERTLARGLASIPSSRRSFRNARLPRRPARLAAALARFRSHRRSSVAAVDLAGSSPASAGRVSRAEGAGRGSSRQRALGAEQERVGLVVVPPLV